MGLCRGPTGSTAWARLRPPNGGPVKCFSRVWTTCAIRARWGGLGVLALSRKLLIFYNKSAFLDTHPPVL